MKEEVKLYGTTGSPFVFRVKLALKLKSVPYEFIEEKLSDKSPELLKYNPIHKKVPVLLHHGNPVAESLVIIEYIDEAWKGYSILPQDPHEKAVARFWAKFVDEKCIHVLRNVYFNKGKAQEKEVEDATELLKILEKELKGKKFFGGDNIGFVDIVLSYIGFWTEILEEVTGLQLMTKEKFPKLSEWVDEFLNCSVVKESLPSRDGRVTYYRRRLGKA